MPTAEPQTAESSRLDQQTKLREFFKSIPHEKHTHGWDELWRDQLTPWDRNRPNPALVDLLVDRPHILGEPFNKPKGQQPATRKKVLVPGCGRGYDVLLFSSYGFNAVGLDAAPTAKEAALKFQSSPTMETEYPVQNEQEGRGEARFIVGDFFSDNFLTETHGSSVSAGIRTFDFIYDYTFLCALPPPLRPKWAARMSQLLAPTGRLICLEYPLGKDPKAGGPPHALSREVYDQLFARPGNKIEYDEATGHVIEDHSGEKAENSLVRVEDWDPPCTFDEMKGKLRVSVWKHWKAE